MKKVFIDGSMGTTGLGIAKRLVPRHMQDLQMLWLTEEYRKDPAARKDAINQADVVILCLPDDAAREAVGMLENPDTVVIDASTAHRVEPGWVYGFPELSGQREKIIHAKRIANPGCHASGFIALVAPLVERGAVRPDANLTCMSLTGYSGGGKKMIAEYEGEARDRLLDAPRMYGLLQQHKHLPEMQKICGLESAPTFCPVVSGHFAGMEVTVPLFPQNRLVSMEEIAEIYADYYHSGVVRFVQSPDEKGFLSAGALAGKDSMEISVWGNKDRMLLVARFDNLGKGASGAAIQNMNLALGLPETTGLVL